VNITFCSDVSERRWRFLRALKKLELVYPRTFHYCVNLLF
jgi:hypothetical protein